MMGDVLRRLVPRRRWWVVDEDDTLVWDCYTSRGAGRLADSLNIGGFRAGRRFRVVRAP